MTSGRDPVQLAQNTLEVPPETIRSRVEAIANHLAEAETLDPSLAVTAFSDANHGVNSGIPSAPAPESGVLIDGVYRMIGPLGQGGMGVVMFAHDDLLDRHVAIKLIRPDLVDNAELRERFLAEARIMARVHHTNVLPIYAFGEYQGAPYFVTEFVAGQTVETWLNTRPAGTLPDVSVALRILEDTCNGVAAIHAAEMVHRDLKPSNLLLDADLCVRVADMGVAHLLRRAGGPRPEGVVGTPGYIAPEILLQSEVPPELGQRADVYSLGCLAFELLTGTPPFPGETSVAQMLAPLTKEAPRPSSLRPDLNDAFDDVILRALAKDPKARTPSVQAFHRGLIAAQNGTYEPVRILVADDDGDFRDLLALTLGREFPDARIECVANGSAALKAFDQRHHSVAILDLQMPDLNGIELTGLLRARDEAHAVALIVITASGGATEWKRLSAMGADGFLVKPVNVKDVVTLVRRALSERARSIPPEEAAAKAAS